MWLALTGGSIAIHFICFVYLMWISGQTAIPSSLPFRPGQHHVRLKGASHHCAMTGIGAIRPSAPNGAERPLPSAPSR